MLGDLRYALRSLRGHPGFTVVAVASLALGMGVNTAIFSLVDQLLLWTVPARDPARLVAMDGGRSSDYPFYREYRDRNQVFSGVFAGSHPIESGVRAEGSPAVEVARVTYVTGGYFETLGIGAAAGRLITNSDDQPGAPPAVVLTYAYWQRRFAGDLAVLGRKLAINGHPFHIAGISERGFSGLFNMLPSDVFVVVNAYPLTTPAAARIWSTPSMHWLITLGRLKPGVSIAQAQAAMRVLWPQVAQAVTDDIVKSGGKARKFKEEQITLLPASRGITSDSGRKFDPLSALLIATGLVLLIACANVANLLLARAISRRQEIAVRLSIGATAARLVRQLLTESLALAALGGVLGIAIAWAGVALLAGAGLVNSELRFHPSPLVAAFSIGLTALTGVLFGLLPAIRAARLDLISAVRGGASNSSREWLAKGLIAGQVALSLTLLVGAGLFLRTLRNLERVDLGFQRENVLMVDVDAARLGYQGDRLRRFYDDLLERTRKLPGVRSAGLSIMNPMGEFALGRSFSAEGYQPRPDERMQAFSNSVSSGYFTALGIPILLGRDFTAQDEPAVTPQDTALAALGRSSGSFSDVPANASHVCILDESLARRLFGSSNPVGRHISYDDRYSAKGAMEIVGVVKDVHQWSVRKADKTGMIYAPTWSNGAEARLLAVRFTGDSGPLAASIRSAVRDMDPDVPVLRTRKLEEYVNSTVERERMVAYLCGFFGALALALASVGLYGVMAHAVSRRTREIGIRMALGARRADVLRMVIRESLMPVAVGLAIGLGCALALAQLVASMLFGVAPRDPVSILLAAALMLAAAFLAASIPARRATAVEPMNALRYE